MPVPNRMVQRYIAIVILCPNQSRVPFDKRFHFPKIPLDHCLMERGTVPKRRLSRPRAKQQREQAEHDKDP
ncbi:MAG: hypothetical protein OHK0029_06630 [Armatimonadaceae bacterium]